MSTTAETPLLSVREAAARLAVSSATVRRLIWAGELPAVRVGNAVRINNDQLADWLEHRKVGA